MFCFVTGVWWCCCCTVCVQVYEGAVYLHQGESYIIKSVRPSHTAAHDVTSSSMPVSLPSRLAVD